MMPKKVLRLQERRDRCHRLAIKARWRWLRRFYEWQADAAEHDRLVALSEASVGRRRR